jgi:hypothetical protein
LQTFCPYWPQTTILPILASQVARITDVNQRVPDSVLFLRMASGADSLG